MEESVLLGTKPLVDSIHHYASVISLLDVTIRAFSNLLNERGFLCRLL